MNDKEDRITHFYVSLSIYDKLLHNCMLDSRASHNLMSKVIMDQLGLLITRPYHDLYSFDSRKVKCLGMIKDLIVVLAKLPAKSIMMDVVVEDVSTKYSIILSRSWAKKLGGTM